MPKYVALLRGINLGKRRVKMPVLADLFTAMGFAEVTTLLASGNVIFATSRQSGPRLESDIADHLQENLGYDVPTRVRSAAEITAVLAADPFGDLFTDQPHANTQITFFDRKVPSAEAKALEALSGEGDRLKVIGRELYWRCATKISESALWKNARRNPHNLPNGTTRNLQTLQKIADRLTA